MSKNTSPTVIVLNDYKAKKADEGAVLIETDAGTFKIPPPDLWADDVMLLSSTDPIGAARALIGDTYDEFVAAGGSAAVLMSIVNDVHGASAGE